MGDSIRYPIMKSVKDAAEIYGLSPAYIRRLCRTGKVRFVNAGHRWLVNMDSLARYFEAGDPGPAGLDGNHWRYPPGFWEVIFLNTPNHKKKRV